MVVIQFNERGDGKRRNVRNGSARTRDDGDIIRPVTSTRVRIPQNAKIAAAISLLYVSIDRQSVRRTRNLISLSHAKYSLTSNHIVFVEKSLPTTTTLRRIFYYLETSPRTGAYSISLGLKRCVQTHSLISLFSLSVYFCVHSLCSRLSVSTLKYTFRI